MTMGSEVNGQLIRMSADNDGTLDFDHQVIEPEKTVQLEQKTNS